MANVKRVRVARQETSKKRAAIPKEPRQKSIPGMEDREIQELQAAGEHYASIRDRRMKLTEEEAQLKSEVRALMLKHDKKTYRFGKVEVELLPGEEKVKVRIHKDKDEETEAV